MANQSDSKALNFYLTEINKIYLSASPEKQQFILGRLETLLADLARPNPLTASAFDGTRARKIRQEAGLSLIDLIRRLRLDNPKENIARARTLISDYEKGVRISVPKRNGNSQQYLLWLKEQGYNPYNL